MEKAILILDEMPKCCDDHCPGYHDGSIRCTMMRKYKLLEDDCDIRRPDWCPLEKAPEPKTMIDVFYSDCTKDCLDVTEAYRKGWNDCLDEIGGD